MLGGSTTVDDSSEFALGSSDVVDASVSLEGDVERTPPRHERGPSLVHDIVTSAIDKAEESAEAWEAVDAAMERATEGISKSGSMAGSRPRRGRATPARPWRTASPLPTTLACLSSSLRVGSIP